MYSPAHHDNDIITFGDYEGSSYYAVYYGLQNSSGYNYYVDWVLKIEEPLGRMLELQIYFASKRGLVRMPNGTYKCCLEVIGDYPDRITHMRTALPTAPPALPTAPPALPPKRMGRPPRPIVCPNCKRVFNNRQEKYKHRTRGKCPGSQRQNPNETPAHMGNNQNLYPAHCTLDNACARAPDDIETPMQPPIIWKISHFFTMSPMHSPRCLPCAPDDPETPE